MRVCSLLVIPPPKESQPPPGGFPKDLSDLNLSSWAGLVQDIASSLMVPPPNPGSDVSLPAMALLDLLEKTTGWVYCRFCYHLGSRCACMGAFPPTWSKVVGESPGGGATASSGGMTVPGMPAAGMSGYLLPPPGLPPIDFTKWRLPLPEAPASGGATAPPLLPGVGRSAGLQGTAKRITGAPHSGGLAQRMPAPPTTMPYMPQMVPPVQQPCLEWPAMPYQQVVQPPKRPVGRGVIADTPANKTTPVGSAMQDHRRPTARGQGHGSQSVSHPRGVPGKVSAQLPHQEGDLLSGSMPGAHHHHHHHLKEPSLSREVGQGLPSGIPCGWQPTFVAVDGGRTWSISSRSTINTASTTLGSQNGPGSRSGSLITSSSIRRKPWSLRRPIGWTLWPTSRNSFIRPPASTWMASGASHVGSRGGAIITG